MAYNVPNDVFEVGRVSYTSGEENHTYFINRRGEAFEVCDWVGSRPYGVSLYDMSVILRKPLVAILRNYVSWLDSTGGQS